MDVKGVWTRDRSSVVNFCQEHQKQFLNPICEKRTCTSHFLTIALILCREASRAEPLRLQRIDWDGKRNPQQVRRDFIHLWLLGIIGSHPDDLDAYASPRRSWVQHTCMHFILSPRAHFGANYDNLYFHESSSQPFKTFFVEHVSKHACSSCDA